MSVLVDGSITFYDALLKIREGRYVMPAFQRQFVWSMEQIEKLWDSILLDYPISTFLFWHLDSANVNPDTYFCEFLHEATFNSRKQSDMPNYELGTVDISVTDTAVLDGQQRLTSLLLSLLGKTYLRQKHARKSGSGGTITKLVIELNEHRLMVDEDEYNSKRFDVRFTDKVGKLSPTQFEIRKVLDEAYRDVGTRPDAIEAAIANVPPSSKEYARSTLSKLCSKIYEEKLVRFTEIRDMKQDDALEMFVRFNSGGKPLKKHEITMSILEAYWPRAKAEFGSVLAGPFADFGTDFIIRTALMLYGDVVKSTIDKRVANELKNDWASFGRTLNELAEFLRSMNIEVERFSKSWNVLLPIIYLMHYNPNYETNREGVRAYLVRAVLFTYFQSGTTSKLQQMKSSINNYNFEITADMLDQIGDLRVTDGKIDDIINSEKGSRVAGEALSFLGAGWMNKNYHYEQDHLHPRDRFDRTAPSGVSREDWIAWRGNRDRLPNLQLLEGRSNGSKSDMSLINYYDEMNNEQQRRFREETLIPDGVSLEIRDFGEFYERRKALLTQRLRELLG